MLEESSPASLGLPFTKVFCEPESGIRRFLLPEKEVLKWFHHYIDGHLTEFWVRKEFPALDLCVVIRDWNAEGLLFIQDYLCLRVNDKMNTIYIRGKYVVSDLLVDHICLYQLRRKFIENELLRLLLPDQWNHIEVSGLEGGAIKSIGIRVYKNETSVDNILFSRPSSLKRTCNDLYNSNMIWD
ncbi:hypothetical protein VNO77_33983 [Canavalia gladiata]|uniref:Uncharacterized protein n=1 Tax=Canavalia gladiata TaxID=3824 RepID=A0AAN9KEV1_CANGL